MESVIIQIGEILVSSEIITEYFCCDYETCGGCCCVIGDSGAPLLDGEEMKLESEYDKFKYLMSPNGRHIVERDGYSVFDIDGERVTPLIGGKECVYSLFDTSGNCFCAIERASENGICKCKKPLSCRLYPIRVTLLSNGMRALNLDRWSICDCAFIKGKREKMPVYKFLREPLTDSFGEEFYSALESAAVSANSFLASK